MTAAPRFWPVRVAQLDWLARLVQPARLAQLARCGSDRGYATIASAGIIAAVVALALVVAAAVSRTADTHRAQVAADLAAVAGATALHTGQGAGSGGGGGAGGGDACAVARETARLNGAELADCSITGADVTVAAVVGGAEAEAKAGPI